MSNNERQFRRMWRWIADETRRQKRHVSKRDYFKAFGIPEWERPFSKCYACEEGRQRARDNDYDVDLMMCDYCPIDWGKCCCTEKGTLYDEWKHTYSYERAAELAQKIAMMEWREEDERAD